MHPEGRVTYINIRKPLPTITHPFTYSQAPPENHKPLRFFMNKKPNQYLLYLLYFLYLLYPEPFSLTANSKKLFISASFKKLFPHNYTKKFFFFYSSGTKN